MAVRAIRLLAGAALLVGLGACAAVGPNFKAPAAPTASGYAMAGDEAAARAALGERLAGDWWSLFGSPELDKTVREAVSGAPSLKAAQAALAQAQEAVGARDPALTGGLDAGYVRDRVNLTSFGFSQFPLPGGQTLTLSNPTFNLYSFGANGRYDLDIFGGRRRERERLLAEADAQGYRAEAAYLTLTAQVVGQAVDIAALRAEIAAAEEIVRSDRETLDLQTRSFELGGGTRLDVETVKTEMAADEGALPPLRRQLAAARHALAALVGQAPSDWTPPDFDLDRLSPPAKIPVALPSELVRERPDIRAAEARLHAATARIGEAQADLYPKLSITGDIAQGALKPADLFSYGATGFSVGPSLSLPLLERGQLLAKRRMADAGARAALADYQQTVLSAFVQVADALEALAQDEQAVALAQEANRSAGESLRLQRLRHQDGKAGLLPVLDSQRSWARARMTLIRAKAQRLKDAAALLYAASRPWTEDAARSSAPPLTPG